MSLRLSDLMYAWALHIDLGRLNSVSVVRNHTPLIHIDQVAIGRCFRNADCLSNVAHGGRGPPNAIVKEHRGVLPHNPLQQLLRPKNDTLFETFSKNFFGLM